MTEQDTEGRRTYYTGLSSISCNGSTPTYFLFNHRGDTVLVSDQSGNTLDQLYYEAYGCLVGKTDSVNCEPMSSKFGGYYDIKFDAKTELSYMHYRWFSTKMMSFISADMLSDINKYRFAYGNPVKYQDSMGLASSGQNVRPIDPNVIEGIPGSGEENLLNASFLLIKYVEGKNDNMPSFYLNNRIMVDPELFSDPEEGRRGTKGWTTNELDANLRKIYLSPVLFGNPVKIPKEGYFRTNLAKNNCIARKELMIINFSYRLNLAHYLYHERVHANKGQYLGMEADAYHKQELFLRALYAKVMIDDPTSYKLPIIANELYNIEKTDRNEFFYFWYNEAPNSLSRPSVPRYDDEFLQNGVIVKPNGSYYYQ